MKQQTAWALITPKGRITVSSIRRTRKECLAKYPAWDDWYRFGYRCRKVIITLDNSKKK